MAPGKRSKSKIDRLSDLPDHLLIYLLSFLDARLVVQLSILSTRYRHLWTFLSNLSFNSEGFRKLSTFDKFVSHVIKGHDHQLNVSLIRYDRRGKSFNPIKRVLGYALSQSVNHLILSACVTNIGNFASRLFQTQSLHTLHIENSKHKNGYSVVQVPKFLSSPFLSVLFLEGFFFRVSDHVYNANVRSVSSWKFPNLKNLTLVSCKVGVSNILDLDCPILKNFNFKLYGDEVCRGIMILTAPNLSHLNLECTFPVPLLFDNLASLVVQDYAYGCVKKLMKDTLSITLTKLVHSNLTSSVNQNVVTISTDDIIQYLSQKCTKFPSILLKLKSLKLKFQGESAVDKSINYFNCYAMVASIVMASVSR